MELFIPPQFQHIPTHIHLSNCARAKEAIGKSLRKAISHTTYPEQTKFNDIGENIVNQLKEMTIKN